SRAPRRVRVRRRTSDLGVAPAAGIGSDLRVDGARLVLVGRAVDQLAALRLRAVSDLYRRCAQAPQPLDLLDRRRPELPRSGLSFLAIRARVMGVLAKRLAVAIAAVALAASCASARPA